MIKSKKGVFFTVDAILAVIIVFVGILIIMNQYGFFSSEQRTSLSAISVLNFFIGTSFDQIPAQQAVNLWCNKNQNTCFSDGPALKYAYQPIASALYILQVKNAGNILTSSQKSYLLSMQGVLSGIVSVPGYFINVSVFDSSNEVTIFQTPRSPIIKATTVVSAKSLVYVHKEDGSIGGPYVAQAVVWK